MSGESDLPVSPSTCPPALADVTAASPLGAPNLHPRNSWEVHKNLVRSADGYLASLQIKDGSQIYDVIHELVWHRGVDPVRWIDDNRELVAEIAQLGEFDDFKPQLKYQLIGSLKKLQRE